MVVLRRGEAQLIETILLREEDRVRHTTGSDGTMVMKEQLNKIRIKFEAARSRGGGSRMAGVNG
jgi:hypothetical protein